MSSIVQNDTSPIDFFMADSADPTGETGKAGLLPAGITFKIAKTGGNFAVGTGTITAITNGRNGAFRYTPVAGDVATLGDVWFEASAAGCFTWADVRRVVQAGAAASDWTSARAAKVDNIDSTTTAIASYVDTEVAAIKAKTDNLPAAPAAVSDVPSAAAIADALLARNQQGGSNNSPTVADALAGGLFDFTISAGTLTVKHGDGTTAFTRTLTRDQTMLLGAIIGAF